jgi:hypothetical protein
MEAPPWSGRDDFIQRLRRRLLAAASGDATAFWRLCHDLQADPNTGRLRPRLDDDVTSWPGVAVLEGGWLDSLLTAAKQHLLTEQPHADEWLGTGQWDHRARAGYLALALLARHGLLETVAATTWATWAPAILWFWTVPVETGDRELKRELLGKVAAAAPDALVDPAIRILHGAIQAHSQPNELEALKAAWAPPLVDALAGELDMLVDDLLDGGTHTRVLADTLTQARAQLQAVGSSEQATAADTPEQQVARRVFGQAQEHAQAFVDTVDLLAKLLVSNGDHRGVEACRRLIDAVPSSRNSLVRSAALHAAKALLRSHPRAHWPSVLTTVRADMEWGDDLAAQMAYDWAGPGFTDQLDEAGLSELYTWLAERYPPETDVTVVGAHWVSPEERIRQWRDRVAQALAERGSAEAVQELASLVRRWPDRSSLKSHLLQAEERQQEAAWTPPTPADLHALLADRHRRLVRTATELSDAVVDALREIAQSLPEHGQLLWDMCRVPRHPAGSASDESNAAGESASPGRTQQEELWRPKNEHALSAYLKDQLQLRLAGRAVVVNREVLVRQTSTSGAGDRVDLLVEATALPGVPTGADIAESAVGAVRVIVEVKGCWHHQLMTAMRDQLADDYLPEASTNHGLYVVGWFPVDQWNDTDDRRRAATIRRDRDPTAAELERQAAELSQTRGLDLRSVVIEVPGLSPSSRNV